MESQNHVGLYSGNGRNQRSILRFHGILDGRVRASTTSPTSRGVFAWDWSTADSPARSRAAVFVRSGQDVELEWSDSRIWPWGMVPPGYQLREDLRARGQ